MADEAKKEPIQFGIEYLKSRTLNAVIREYHTKVDRKEIEKQWNAANKK